MKSLAIALVAAGLALAAASLSPHPARSADKCLAFAVKAQPLQPGARAAIVSVTPAADGVTYNWMTSGGTIVSGQGTAEVIIDISGAPAGSTLTVEVELSGTDPACPPPKGLSATLRIP